MNLDDEIENKKERKKRIRLIERGKRTKHKAKNEIEIEREKDT